MSIDYFDIDLTEFCLLSQIIIQLLHFLNIFTTAFNKIHHSSLFYHKFFFSNLIIFQFLYFYFIMFLIKKFENFNLYFFILFFDVQYVLITINN